MGDKTFKELIAGDVKDIFLSDDFSVEAIYKSDSSIKKVQIQLFEEPLDKMGSTFYHAWCDYSDLPYVKDDGDTLTVDGGEYGIKDSDPDEFQTGLNLFLQKVV